MTDSRFRLTVRFLPALVVGFQVCLAEEFESPQIIVMVSSVFGSPTPSQEEDQILPNGNFEIIRNTSVDERVKVVGNGLDEFMLWTFDFTTHPHIDEALACVTTKPKYIITEARLTLDVKPTAETGWADVVYIQGSACNHTAPKLFNPPGYSELEPKKTHVIDFDIIEAGHTGRTSCTTNSGLHTRMRTTLRKSAVTPSASSTGQNPGSFR